MAEAKYQVANRRLIKDPWVVAEFDRLEAHLRGALGGIRLRDPEAALEVGLDNFVGGFRPPEGFFNSSGVFAFSDGIVPQGAWSLVLNVGLEGVAVVNPPSTEFATPIVAPFSFDVRDPANVVVRRRVLTARPASTRLALMDPFYSATRGGTYQEWDAVGTSDHGEALNAFAVDGVNKYLETSTSGNRESVFCDDTNATISNPTEVSVQLPTGNVGSITSVTFQFNCGLTVAGSATVSAFVRIGGVDYYVTTLNPTITTVWPTTSSPGASMTTSPATGVAWTITEFLNAEYGIRYDSGTPLRAQRTLISLVYAHVH